MKNAYATINELILFLKELKKEFGEGQSLSHLSMSQIKDVLFLEVLMDAKNTESIKKIFEHRHLFDDEDYKVKTRRFSLLLQKWVSVCNTEEELIHLRWASGINNPDMITDYRDFVEKYYDRLDQFKKEKNKSGLGFKGVQD